MSGSYVNDPVYDYHLYKVTVYDNLFIGVVYGK